MASTPQLPDSSAIEEALETIAGTLAPLFDQPQQTLVAGIADGGINLAQAIARRLSRKTGRSIEGLRLNCAFHRDDVRTNPTPKAFSRSTLPHDIDDATIILVDDVIQSGRTIRAALGELFDRGRPARVKLAVLFDRGGRALPIQPDVSAFTIELPETDRVSVVISLDNPDGHRIVVSPA